MMNMTPHRRSHSFASVCISLALALPAAGQVTVGRVDVTPSGGSLDARPKANVVGEVGKGYKVAIETLNEGQAVTFEEANSPKGPRAENVTPVE